MQTHGNEHFAPDEEDHHGSGAEDLEKHPLQIIDTMNLENRLQMTIIAVDQNKQLLFDPVAGNGPHSEDEEKHAEDILGTERNSSQVKDRQGKYTPVKQSPEHSLENDI